MKSHITDIPLFREWLKDRKFLADSSIYTYTKSLEHFLKSNPDIDKLEPYNDFLIQITIKKRTTHHFSVLKSYIEFKIDEASLKHKLIDGLVRPKIRNDLKQERAYLSEEELIKVINNIEDEKHQMIAVIQTFTGLRAGDIFRLKRQDIIPEVYKDEAVLKLVVLGKGQKRNVVYLHNKVIQEMLMGHLVKFKGFKDYAFLKLGEHGTRLGNIESETSIARMNYLWYWQDIKQALQLCHFDKDTFSTHDFRRCFARRVWEKWKDIHILQRILRHSDPKVTMRYLDQSGLQNIDYHKEMQL